MVSYNGFNSKVITISKATEENMLGKIVTVSGNNAVVAPKNSEFVGVCVSDNGAYLGVQVEGYVECPYTGTISECGWAHIVSNGTNEVATATATAGSVMRRVMKLDTDNKIVGFIL